MRGRVVRDRQREHCYANIATRSLFWIRDVSRGGNHELLKTSGLYAGSL